jgi:hypothetical protein
MNRVATSSVPRAIYKQNVKETTCVKMIKKACSSDLAVTNHKLEKVKNSNEFLVLFLMVSLIKEFKCIACLSHEISSIIYSVYDGVD